MTLPTHIEEAIRKYVPLLDGGDWATMERRCEMAEIVYESDAKVVVEIGTFGGASAIPMAFALRERNSGGKLYCLDPWRVDYAIEGESDLNRKWYENNVNIHEVHRKAMEAIWSHNLDHWLVVIRAASQHCVQLFNEIDVLLIDGCHSEVASLRDAELYAPKVRSGGFILVDDVNWGYTSSDGIVVTTQKAVEFVAGCADLVKSSGSMNFYKKR